MHAPEQRCAALAQVRQINYCFVCKKLIFSIYGSSPGQLPLLKSTRKAPVLCPFGWFLLCSRHDFGGSVWVSLTSDAEGMQGTFFGGWQKQVHCLFPLREKVYCAGQWNWGHLGSFWKSSVFPSPPSKCHAASPSHPFSPTCWPAQPADPCQPTAIQKCQLWCQTSPRAAVSISLVFHVGRRVQFHFRCAASLLIPSLFSPPLSFSALRVCAFCSTELRPSVAWSQALM